MIFPYISTVLNLVLLAVVLHEITQRREAFDQIERVGLGLLGGGLLLVLPVRFTRFSPFEGWATLVFVLGITLYMAGRSWRNYKHARNNRRQIRNYEASRR